MTTYPFHVQATRDALTLIGMLPANTVWSFFVASNDDPVTPGTFNVYAPPEEWSRIRLHLYSLNLGDPVETGEDYETYRYRALMLSFTKEN